MLTQKKSSRSLWPSGFWECGFESRLGHGLSCGCRELSGRGLCDRLIPRPEKRYRVWFGVCVCVWSGPTMTLHSYNDWVEKGKNRNDDSWWFAWLGFAKVIVVPGSSKKSPPSCFNPWHLLYTPGVDTCQYGVQLTNPLMVATVGRPYIV